MYNSKIQRVQNSSGQQGQVTPFFPVKQAPNNYIFRDPDPIVLEEEKKDPKKEAVEKAAEAISKTPQFDKYVLKPLKTNFKEKVWQHPWGKALTIGTAASMLSASYMIDPKATSFLVSKGFSFVPFDKIYPGLSATLDIEGPINSPTKISLIFKLGF
jgi:hypothetical protein